MTGIVCPTCSSSNIGVRDSRPARGVQRRRYLCACGHRFTTIETVVQIGSPVVVSLGGRTTEPAAQPLEQTLARRRHRLLSAVESAMR